VDFILAEMQFYAVKLNRNKSLRSCRKGFLKALFIDYKFLRNLLFELYY
jgi:hypothetical protein